MPLNVVGPQVAKIRQGEGWSQDRLATKLQLSGWDTSRESIAKLEKQRRRVPDLEVFLLARIFGVKSDDLYPKLSRAKVRELGPHYRAKLSRGQVPPSSR